MSVFSWQAHSAGSPTLRCLGYELIRPNQTKSDLHAPGSQAPRRPRSAPDFSASACQRFRFSRRRISVFQFLLSTFANQTVRVPYTCRTRNRTGKNSIPINVYRLQDGWTGKPYPVPPPLLMLSLLAIGDWVLAILATTLDYGQLQSTTANYAQLNLN